MKKVLAIVLASLMVLSLAACAKEAAPAETAAPAATEAAKVAETEAAAAETEAAPAAEEKLTITYVVPNIAHPTFLCAKEAFERAAVDFNFEPIFTGSSAFDVNDMVKEMELAIASKVDGIIVMASVPSALQPVIQEASDAGIPVCTIIADCADADRLAYLGLNNYNYGQIAGEEALKALNGETPVVACMVPTFENTSGIQINESLNEYFTKNAPDYKWVTTVESNTDAVTAVRLWEEVLTTYPEVNTIFCISAEGGYCAATVMKERGLTADDITVVAISDLDQTLQDIRDGYIHCTMSENIPRVGYQPAQWICEYVREGKKPELINDTGTFAITKENVDNYKDIENDTSLWK